MKVGMISPPHTFDAGNEFVLLKAGLVQYSPVWEAPEENIRILNGIINAGPVNCDFLIFPEMTLTGFTMHAEQFAEEIDGVSTLYFIDLAQRLKKHIFAGIIERDGDKIYNSLVHFDENGLINTRYRKIHPYSYAHEDKSYTAGDTLVITKIGHTRIGLTICYDLRFPELYRLYGKAKPEIMINIANWPVPRIDHYVTLLKARAIENQCFTIGVNRTGTDMKNNYNGCSCVFDPLGKELLLAENKEGIFTVDLEVKKVNETRSALPFLDDMKLI